MSEKSESDSDWIVIDCSHCERAVKLSISMQHEDVACPYCSASLSGASSTERPNDGSEVRPSAPGGEVTPASSPLEEKDRRKRRGGGKSDITSPEWDQDEPSEPTNSDEDDVNEYVEIDPNNPDAVRVRRVRKKRLMTPWQKIFRVVSTLFIALAALICITILISYFVKGADTVTKDLKEVAELPERVQTLVNAAKADGIIPSVLTEAETKAAEAILSGYVESAGWRNKLAYVHNQERARPRMESWYARSDDGARKMGKILRRDKIVKDGKYIIKLAIESDSRFDGEPFNIFALRQTPTDIKIDWESSVGYQEMTLNEFKKTRPQNSVAFRVKVQGDSYYNHHFSDKEKFLSVLLVYPGDPDFLLYGYLDREDPSLQPLIETLSHSSPSAIVGLRYPPIVEEDNQVEVAEVISMTWFE